MGGIHTTTTTTLTRPTSLDEELLERFRARAAYHNSVARYPTDDLAELVSGGWLTAPAPAEFGGLGLDLATVAAEQRRMALTRRPPLCRRRCTCTGSAWPPICTGSATHSAPAS